MSIGVNTRGDLLLSCKSNHGCSPAGILAALGMKPGEMFADYKPSGNGTRRKGGRGRIVAEYDYRDESGALLYQVVRFDPKDFRQRRPDGAGGWSWKLDGVRRVPYKLPEVIGKPGALTFVAEGEKDVDSLVALGLLASCNPQGAGKWRKLDPAAVRLAFSGRPVVVLPDADEPGIAHGRDVARSLAGLASSVKLVEIHDLPDHGAPCKDVTDWLAAGGTRAELQAVAERAPEFHGSAESEGSEQPEREDKRKSQAAELLEMIRGMTVATYHDPADVPYIDVERDDRRETYEAAGRAFRDLVRRAYYRATERVPNPDALAGALGLVSAMCRYDGATREVALRVAEDDGAVYLDLADASWRAVEIRPGSWRLVESPPVRFRRPKGMLPLPEPVGAGSIAELSAYVNVRMEASEWPLLVAWLAFALRERGPFPVLSLHGQQGSAKSTTARIVKSLIDPSRAGLRAEPADLRDLAIASESNWLVAWDNMSSLPRWLSDALCRLATGGGFATRELYSDRDESLFDAIRPTLLTGIEEVAAAGDLLDRSLLVTLPEIDEDRRSEESSLWSAFEAARPRIFGALLDLVAGALAVLPKIRPEKLLRMADFHRWGLAVELAAGWSPGTFETAYRENRGDAATIQVEDDPVAGAVARFTRERGAWLGTSERLLSELRPSVDEQTLKGKRWPSSGRGLSGRLRRTAPALAAVGISILFERDNTLSRNRLIHLRALDAEGRL